MSSKTDTSQMIFLTGNEGKFAEALQIIPTLKRVELDLPEIQALDTRVVLEHKIQSALARGHQNVIVEDTSLHFTGLNGLPGPLIKWFLEALGVQGLYDFAHKLGVPSVTAVCLLGYSPPAGSIVYCAGEIPGKLVPPRGSNGFGWDAIFLPDGFTKTFAEMTLEEKGQVSHRKIAFQALKNALT